MDSELSYLAELLRTRIAETRETIEQSRLTIEESRRLLRRLG